MDGNVLRTKSFFENSQSHPSTELELDAFDAQQISTPAHSIMVQIGNVSSELMVQIKQKGVYEVENPPPSFLGG